MIIKNNENCEKCMWYAYNECNEYANCIKCPNYDERCNCRKIENGAICLYFKPTGSPIPYATTPEEFKSELEAIIERENIDDGTRHARMDELMCKVLTDLGYGEGVAIFEKTPKYYE